LKFINYDILIIIINENQGGTNGQFFRTNLLILKYGYDVTIEIHDTYTLILLSATTHKLHIHTTNDCLNVLITGDFQYYRIDKKYRWERAIVGENYLMDCKYELGRIKAIMVVILNIDLPLEIICLELYQAIVDL